jgi:hypothetical protein
MIYPMGSSRASHIEEDAGIGHSMSRAKPGTSQTPMIARKYRVSENMHDARVG